MSTYWLTGMVIVLGVAIGSAQEKKQRIVDEQLRYLEHLQTAESHLASGDADAALAELDKALSCEVLDSHVPFLGLETKKAVAHYLRACAFAGKQDSGAAIKCLKAAAANGYRNTNLVKSDPRLASLRKSESFSKILEKFPSADLSDEFAGKTVADRSFGLALQKHRLGNFPKLGEVAPDFELDLLGNEASKLRLSSFRKEKPVVLVFGSFT